MMTKRLFDTEPRRTIFTAVVQACEKNGRGFSIVLDQTCFFPEEGGQSADKGVLIVNGKKLTVQDAQIDKDNVIHHIVKESIPEGTEVRGEIDWQKRFSDMQQHTGEHIVSGLIHAAFGYNNVGFHLSANEVTLDVDGILTAEDITEIERKANEVVYANKQVIAEYPDEETLEGLSYRSKIEIDGPVRIVTIPDVDVCACCAPHVDRTGEIGLIKIIHAAKYKSGVRLNMLCGGRALKDAQIKQEQVEAIGIALSVKQNKTAAAVEKLQKELAQIKFQMSAMGKQIAVSRAQGIPVGTANVCLFEKDMDKDVQRELVNQVTARCTGYCGVFVGSNAGGWRYIVGSAGPDAREFNKKLKDACGARGGGSTEMVQGSLSGTEDTIRALFE